MGFILDFWWSREGLGSIEKLLGLGDSGRSVGGFLGVLEVQRSWRLWGVIDLKILWRGLGVL